MERLRQSIEETAQTWEKIGLTPVSARVYSYLLYAPHYATTFEDLTEYFNVSKSAISNAIKYLNLVGMVGSKTKQGQRKRYFGAELDYILNKEYVLMRYGQMRDMLKTVLEKRTGGDPLEQELEYMMRFFDYAMAEFPLFIERWKNSDTKRAK